MKIVFLLQDPGAVYGAERATVNLVAGLKEAGVEVHVLLISEQRATTTLHLTLAFRKTRAVVESIPVAGRFSRALVGTVRERLAGADVLHTTGYKADLHGRTAVRGTGVAHVGTVHGWLFRADLKERFYGWMNLAALRRMDAVVALSSYYERYLRSHGVERVVRIPTGLAPGPVHPVPEPDTPFTFGWLGRLSSEKNPRLFVDAAAAVATEDTALQFLIGGAGPEQGGIAAAVERAHLADRTRLTGYVPTDDFLANIDVLVLTSDIENLPVVIMEAMARGLPVIATDVGGVPDLVEDGVTGWIVPPRDVPALAAAMRNAAMNRDVTRERGRAGRERLRLNFPPQGWIRAHQALYAGLASHDAPFAALESAVKSALIQP